jgi:hypothetical protein
MISSVSYVGRKEQRTEGTPGVSGFGTAYCGGTLRARLIGCLRSDIFKRRLYNRNKTGFACEGAHKVEPDLRASVPPWLVFFFARESSNG